MDYGEPARVPPPDYEDVPVEDVQEYLSTVTTETKRTVEKRHNTTVDRNHDLRTPDYEDVPIEDLQKYLATVIQQGEMAATVGSASNNNNKTKDTSVLPPDYEEVPFEEVQKYISTVEAEGEKSTVDIQAPMYSHIKPKVDRFIPPPPPPNYEDVPEDVVVDPNDAFTHSSSVSTLDVFHSEQNAPTKMIPKFLAEKKVHLDCEEMSVDGSTLQMGASASNAFVHRKGMKKTKHSKKKSEMSGHYTTETRVVETTEYYADAGPAVDLEMPEVDSNYVKTLGGIVKIIAIVLCFLTFICVLFGGPGYYTGAGWATFVSTVGMSVTTTLLFLYIFKVVDALPKFPWIIAEMCFCFAWTIFFFIAGSVLAVAASQYRQTAGWAAAAFFAFAAMCTYGFDCYLKFLSWKGDEIATGRGSAFLAEQKRRFNQTRETERV